MHGMQAQSPTTADSSGFVLVLRLSGLVSFLVQTLPGLVNRRRLLYRLVDVALDRS